MSIDILPSWYTGSRREAIEARFTKMLKAFGLETFSSRERMTIDGSEAYLDKAWGVYIPHWKYYNIYIMSCESRLAGNPHQKKSLLHIDGVDAIHEPLLPVTSAKADKVYEALQSINLVTADNDYPVYIRDDTHFESYTLNKWYFAVTSRSNTTNIAVSWWGISHESIYRLWQAIYDTIFDLADIYDNLAIHEALGTDKWFEHKYQGYHYDVLIETLELNPQTFATIKRTGMMSVGNCLDMAKRGWDVYLYIENFTPEMLEELKQALIEKEFWPDNRPDSKVN